MHILLLLPILIPFLTAIVSLFFWNQRNIQRVLSTIGAAGLLGAALALLNSIWQNGIQAIQFGGWVAPFGITLVADLLSAIMVVLTGLMGLAVGVYSLANIDARRESFGYYPLFHLMLVGICGAFLTGDLFNMYVWFEVLLISSFVLMALGGERSQLEGGLKYVTLNLISSLLFLIAVGILYGLTGTLNMAHLARRLAALDQPGLVTTVSILFMIAYGIKAALFPVFFWLPSSYHTPPAAISAIFAGMLTKVGVYALIRVFTLLFVQNVGYTHTFLLMTIAGLTMVTGVLGAASQNEFRRILSFHIISQIGYMIMGLALYSPLALAGAVFYIAHHIIVKTNLFLVSGVVHRLQGSYELKKLGGLYRTHLALGILFLIPALSLAGVPPLSGFWAKFMLIKAGLETGQYAIVATALVVSILTLFSMTKIWAQVFWKELPPDNHQDTLPETASTAPVGLASLKPLILPIVLLAALTVAIGLYAEPLFSLSTQAAEQLLHPTGYIQTVLGETL